jgi:hypothetical protein
MNVFTKALLAVIFLIVVLPMGAIYVYYVYPVDSFCKDINENDKSEDIMSRARTKGLFPHGWQGSDTIWIVNHDQGTTFRIACSVEFKGGKVSRKEIVDAD